MIKAEHKAGLQLSVSAIKGILSKGSNAEIIEEMVVAIAAATEYFVAEILELAGNTTRDNKRMRITEEFIKVAIEKDDELKQTFNAMPIIFDSSLPTFRTQIRVVVKQVHPHTSIAVNGIEYIDAIIHTFIKDCSNQIQSGVTDVSDIMHTILYGKLATFATNEAKKAVKMYNSWTPPANATNTTKTTKIATSLE